MFIIIQYYVVREKPSVRYPGKTQYNRISLNNIMALTYFFGDGYKKLSCKKLRGNFNSLII